MNPVVRSFLFWGLVFTVMLLVFSNLSSKEDEHNEISYSKFLNEAEAGRYSEVSVVESRTGSTLYAETADGTKLMTKASRNDLFLLSQLRDAGVDITVHLPVEESLLLRFIYGWGPILLLIGVGIYLMRNMQGGRGGAFSFGKSRARMIDDDANPITFKDVAGCDEAKEEVEEIVDFLKDPKKYQKLGGKIPRGVLLVGLPGTGKTLLAKAIAGESQVPFFSISGSDFVEMFVGVGAARVRDMFEQARAKAPCIIFIDEIDAVGRQRGAGMGNGNDEREQTLNQMLVGMDGFDENLGVIVIAATNRPDVLDPALKRPGRFDREVVVPLPDIRGRTEILKVHMRKVPCDDRIVVKDLARGTPGFSGASLANLVNEAALMAARSNRQRVLNIDFERAKEKIIMGSERKSVVMPEHERKNTAYHESGHAIVAHMLKNTDPVHKVTIIPRGRALGVTMQLPVEDRYSMNRDQIVENICMLLAGRAAEEIFMNQMTTGASNDFERATDMARRMVTQWGMSSYMGAMVSGEAEGEIFLGRSLGTHRQISEETLRRVDNEIREIMDTQFAKATQLLKDNADKVEVMVKALLDWESIDKKQIDDIVAGRTPRPPENSEDDDTPVDADDGENGDDKSSVGMSNENPTAQA